MLSFLRAQRRRIRARSALLSSYRKDGEEWERWLRWEGVAKPLIPVSLLTALHFSWLEQPFWLAMVVLAITVLWMGFVFWHAATAAFRFNDRQLAFLRAAGVECELMQLLSSRRAWRMMKGKRTVRELLDGPPITRLEDDRG